MGVAVNKTTDTCHARIGREIEMSIVDNVSFFAKGVGAKAKGNYDIIAMNGQITSIEKEISQLYKELGSRYYEGHKEDAEEALSGFVDEINKKRQQIEDLQKEVDKTRATTAAIPLTVNEDNLSEQEVEVKKCQQCGAIIMKDALFCRECGAEQKEEQQTPE